MLNSNNCESQLKSDVICALYIFTHSQLMKLQLRLKSQFSYAFKKRPTIIMLRGGDDKHLP